MTGFLVYYREILKYYFKYLYRNYNNVSYKDYNENKRKLKLKNTFNRIFPPVLIEKRFYLRLGIIFIITLLGFI